MGVWKGAREPVSEGAKCTVGLCKRLFMPCTGKQLLYQVSVGMAQPPVLSLGLGEACIGQRSGFEYLYQTVPLRLFIGRRSLLF